MVSAEELREQARLRAAAWYEARRPKRKPCAKCGKPYEGPPRAVGRPRMWCDDCRAEQRALGDLASKARWADKKRKPCARCGGPKPFGAKHNCDACAEIVRAEAARRHRNYRGIKGEWRDVLEGDPCCYCGAPFEHVDHIEPRSLGGAHEWPNMTAACRSCNGAKHTKPLLAFLLDRATVVH